MSCLKSQPAEITETEWVDAPRLPRAPWNTALHGMVTLYDMLKYAAADFYKLSEEFSTFVLTPMILQNPSNQEQLRKSLVQLHEYCEKLDLPMSSKQIRAIVDAVNGHDVDRVRRSFMELQQRVHDELQNKVCFCLPVEKVKYWHPLWLTTSPIYDRFRSAHQEFQRAGHCYAFGENTACVFHLMRIVDFALRKVAGSLGITYEAHNWMGIAQAIQKNMEQKYQVKTDAWKQSEPMYAEILTDIQAISRGHRNKALHELEKKYDETDAEYMLTVVEGFMLHLAKHGFKE